MGKHKPHRCSTCGKTGHNTATCPEIALVRAKHGMATDEELVVVITRMTYAGDQPIAHVLHEGLGHLRVYPKGAIDPRAHLGIPAEEVPFFKSLPEAARYFRAAAEQDGLGEMWHRPVTLSLRGAKRAFPGALFGEPRVEYT